jgi:integrase
VRNIGEYRREDGTVAWKIRYRVPIAPGAKRTRQKTETLRECRSRRQAEGVLADRKARVFRQEYQPRANREILTVREFAERGSAPNVPKEDRVPSFYEIKENLDSLAWYKRAFDLHVFKPLGHLALVSVTTSHCEDYRRARLREGAAEATIRNELRYLQSLFVEAKKRGLMDADPVANMSFEALDNERARVLSADERNAVFGELLRLDEADDFRPFVFVLFFTGMRCGNALRLKWEHVRFDLGTLILQKTKTKQYRPPLAAALHGELLRWRQFDLQSEYVFPGTRSDAAEGHRGYSWARRHWAEICKRAGVGNLNMHDFRHNLVSTLRAFGAGDKAIMQVSGHSTLVMLNRYDHPELGAVKAHVDRLADLTPIPNARQLPPSAVVVGREKDEIDSGES